MSLLLCQFPSMTVRGALAASPEPVLSCLNAFVCTAASHLVRYTQPDQQRYVVRILFMVPIYAVESWFALRFKMQSIYLETCREAYEAYAIFSFYKLMESWCGTTAEVGLVGIGDVRFRHGPVISQMQEKLKTKTKLVPHLKPFCCLPPWRATT